MSDDAPNFVLEHLRAPDLATKTDLNGMEHRLLAAIHTVEMRSLGVIAVLLGLSIAIIKLV